MKGLHLLGVIVAFAFASACSDSVISVERDFFGQDGQKWCSDVRSWKFVKFDPLNCGDCSQPCPQNHGCFDGVCKPNESSNNPSSTNYCSDYRTCAYYGCDNGCQADSDCLAIEQACADEAGKTLEELRDLGYVALTCNVTTGKCYIPIEEPPPEDEEDPETPPTPNPPPPSVNKSDTCCGSSCTNCTTTNRSCEGSGTNYACECTGCEDDGQCYPTGHRKDFFDHPGYECGASCQCLSSSAWGACTPLQGC